MRRKIKSESNTLQQKSFNNDLYLSLYGTLNTFIILYNEGSERIEMNQLKPTEKQLAFQSWEFGLFIHFGLRTFYEGYVDFDKRDMSPEKFNPNQLNCEQWIETAKKAGMKYAVLTAKHHDGFSNWPSDYTDFSVADSPWKNGQGDVIADFVDACRKYDIKPGLYYSPYDGAADFYEDKDSKAYDDYFVNQITELLGNYGEIDILWFDGAGSAGHEYDWPRIVKQIRTLQPNILIFNMADPDFRWIGNEDGIAPISSFNVVNHVEVSIYDKETTTLTESRWLPAECDVQMRSNWFYSDQDEDTIKSLKELMGIYYHSVGRGTNLLLNIGPNREGVLPAKDTERLLEFGEEIRKQFEHPILSEKNFKRQDDKWIYQTNNPKFIERIVIQEDLTEGENIIHFKVNIITAKTRHHVLIHEGRNIGNKIIIPIPPVKVSGLVIEVVERIGHPQIHKIAVY